jgi:hypothetical protein
LRRDSAEKDSRIRRLRASHSYGLVLVLILSTFLFALVVPDGRWGSSALVLLQCATLVCALWTSGIAELASRTNVALLTLGGGAAIANLIIGGRVATGATSLFAGLLTVAVIVVVGRGVLDQGDINTQSVRGAIGIYVLIGLLFAFFYGAIAGLGSSHFFAQGTDGTRPLRVYFSYVTMTTVGYGDYTPAGTLGHALAVMEALLGQVYLVTVVALLVSRLGQGRRGGPEDTSSLIPPG